MIENMRVCMISASFLPTIGGLQFEVKYLSEELAKQGVETFLLSYDDGASFLRESKEGFPKFIKLRHKNPIFGCVELYKLIKEISPQVIHVHSAELSSFQIAVLRLLKLINQPFVITSHGVDIMIHREIGYGLRLNPINTFLINFILKQCTRHVIVGKSMKKFALEAGSKLEKIIEINNGIPLITQEIPKEKFDFILQKYEISSNDIILLSLSGMRPLKGIDYLVKSMPVILKQFPNAKLLLACNSESKYGSYIRNLVDSLNLSKKVKFISFVTNEEEKTVLLRRCDIFCKPSFLEACSMAILEAIREGKTVVASIPGGIDIITHGRNGLLTQPRDPDDFADKVIKVLKNKNLRKKLESTAKEDSKNFDIQKIVKEYIRLYAEIYKS